MIKKTPSRTSVLARHSSAISNLCSPPLQILMGTLLASAQARSRRRNRPANRMRWHCRGLHRFHATVATRHENLQRSERNGSTRSERCDLVNHNCHQVAPRTFGSVHQSCVAMLSNGVNSKILSRLLAPLSWERNPGKSAHHL
jgi:hypothetical protein